MRDEHFEIFTEQMGEATTRHVAPPDHIERYRGVLPDYLLKVWGEEGWCAYRHGLFWTVDPADYEALIANWLRGTPLETIDKYHVFARTAFGDLYAWGERNHRRITISCPRNVIYAFDSLGRPNSQPDRGMGIFFSGCEPGDYDWEDDDGDDGDWLFGRALKRFGALSRMEIYGFEPALPLGGSSSLTTMKKVNLFDHLGMLRDRAGPPDVPSRVHSIANQR
jgi:hypothetical protein